MDIRKLSVNVLATMVGVFAPDNENSPGAEFLSSVRDTYADNTSEINEDTVYQWAENDLPPNTYQAWLTFADLGAWELDMSDWGRPDPNNLTESVAYRALTIIAANLMGALMNEDISDYVSE